MRRLILNPPRGTTAKQLEFEAKLGEIVPNPAFKQCVNALLLAGKEDFPGPVFQVMNETEANRTWSLPRNPT